MDENASEEKPDDVPLWLSIFGWYGATAIVGAYFLLSHQVIEEEDLLFQLMNVTGSAGVGLVCWRRRAWSPMALEVVWCLVGLSALARSVL